MPRPTPAQISDRLSTSFALDDLWRETMGLPDGDTKERALRDLATVLSAAGTRYALIGGVAIQLYSEEPRTTLDLAIALASYDDIPRLKLEAAGFQQEGVHEHSENWRAPGTEPRKRRTAIQFSVDRLTSATVARAETFKIGDFEIRVATMADLVRLKLEAAEAPTRRPSKRLSDLRDILSLLEEHPEIEAEVPDARRRVAQVSLVATSGGTTAASASLTGKKNE
jgi:hypothetical protein